MKTILAALVMLAAIAPAQAGWIVACQGSGKPADFKTEFVEVEELDGQLSDGYIRVGFKQAASGALAPEGLFGGQCSWLDRSLGQGEGKALCLRATAKKKGKGRFEYALPDLAALQGSRKVVLFSSYGKHGDCLVVRPAPSQSLKQPNPAPDSVAKAE